MAIIPLKQTVTIIPASKENEWGEVIPGKQYKLKCRFSQGTKLVRSASGASGVHGVTTQEVVSVGEFIFDKHPDLKYGDKLVYTDDNGNTIEYMPLNIAVKPWLNGKSLITVVSV